MHNAVTYSAICWTNSTSSFMHIAIMSIQWSGTKTPWTQSHRNGWRWIFLVALSIVSMCVVWAEFVQICAIRTRMSRRNTKVSDRYSRLPATSFEPCTFVFPYEINSIGTKTMLKRRCFFSYCQQFRHWCDSYLWLSYFACRCVFWLSLVVDFVKNEKL